MIPPEHERTFLAALPVLRGYTGKLCSTVEDADDLFQDTAFKALCYLDRYEEMGHMNAWLCRIAHGIFVSGYRREKRAQELIEARAHDPDREVQTDPLDRLLEIEALDETVSALYDEIRQEYVDPLIMLIDDASYKEIGAELSIPVGTVMSRLFRGRQRAKEVVGDGTKRRSG